MLIQFDLRFSFSVQAEKKRKKPQEQIALRTVHHISPQSRILWNTLCQYRTADREHLSEYQTQQWEDFQAAAELLAQLFFRIGNEE